MKAWNYYRFIMIPIMLLLVPFAIAGEISSYIIDNMQHKLDRLQKFEDKNV